MYRCEFCGKEFKSKLGVGGHKGHCKLNPNYNEEKHRNLQVNASIAANKKKKEIALKEKQKDELTRKERILKCASCGKEYKLNLTDNEFYKGYYKKCCSNFCSHSHKHSEETKQKIRKNCTKKLHTDNCRQIACSQKNPKVYKLLSELIKNDNYVLNLDNYNFNDKYININLLKLHKCTNCGKEFYGRITKYGNFVNTKQCCDKCQLENNKRQAKVNAQKRIESGTFQGWKSRNILSYAEKFWITVLENNKIEFIPNKPVKKSDNINNYFLDFYIEHNSRKIDLEIDGKQHKYKDRHESDLKRDAYLKSLGYEVYRIEWNSINNDKGKELMKNKIDSFLTFYYN